MSSAIFHITILHLLRTTLIKTEGWRGLCFDARARGSAHFPALAGKGIAEGAPRSLVCGRRGLGFDAER